MQPCSARERVGWCATTSSAEAKNSLLQLSTWGQVSNNDRDAIDTGADSAASDETSHAAAQSVITQVCQSHML